MGNSTYRRAHTARRRRYSGQSAREPHKVPPLLVCLGILLFAVAINYIFPHFSKALGDKVSSVVDYRSAFAMIGEGLTGERSLAEALGEAWTLAFRGSGDGAEEASVPAMAEVTPTPEPADDTVNTQGIDTTSGGENPGGAHAETAQEAVIAAFIESQRDYPDYMTPAGAGYGLF